MHEPITSQPPWAWVQIITFYVIAGIMVIGAIGVVTLRNIFHSVLCLAVVAIGAAGLFLMLDAEFVAIVQILVYVGAVVTLIAFVTMLTQRGTGKAGKTTNDQKPHALIICVVLLGLFLWKLPKMLWKTTPASENLADITTIGNALITTYLLPFEIIAIILLVALLGAVVLARRESK